MKRLRFSASMTSSFVMGMLLAFLAPSGIFGTPTATAMAVLALLFAVVVDGVIGTAPDEWRGLRIGLPVGFFFRQSSEFPRLAPGAEKVLLLAGVIWVGALIYWVMKDRKPAQSV